MTQVLLGIDAGTTVIKTVAFTLDGASLHRSSVENAVENPESGWAEQSMETTWGKTARTVRAVVESLEEDAEIVGLGVTGQGDGCWLIDEAGDPVRPAILWSDGRAGEYVKRWQEEGIEDRLYDICGGSQFPGSSLAILRWLKDNEPETVEAASTVFWCKDWLKYRLTGVRATDFSDASLPYLDVAAQEYSDEVLSVVDMPEIADMLPPLVPGTKLVGEVTEAAARRTGLPNGTPVVSGFFDVPASAIGSGAVMPGDGSSVVGTTSLSQTLLDEPITGPGRVGMTAALDEGRWSRFMASMTGTPNLDWAIEEIMDKTEFDLVEEEVECVPIGSDGVLYHPFLSVAGERAPFSDPNARAQFMGLTQEHTQAHLVRAVYEGISLAMRDCYDSLPYDANEIYLSGGGANSDFWCQMFADCLDATILVPEGEEFGAKGAALLAGIATGRYDDLESAVRETSSVSRSFEPRPECVEQYRRWYDVYKSAYEATFDVWDRRIDALDDLRRMATDTAGIEPSETDAAGKI
ncbi:FGGY-family carbohydrate kinase [Halomarina halobia]|uniref:FGGY-family carbohydrate kinase n=1 Tax=Halomarina halobia TaxID=3033386 RepID=A0ABD6ADI0_9EURY|nr:FGGY-family carbohydrate kinase [Halomarina sp. PSR21]